MSGFRSALYLWARLLGDFNAARRGPKAIAMRVARKALWRQLGKGINRIR